MAKVKVKLFTTLGRKLINEDSEFDAANVAELLNVLGDKYGSEFKDEIFDGKEIKNFYIVLHNGQIIDREKPEDISLSNGDTVHIFPPVSGG